MADQEPEYTIKQLHKFWNDFVKQVRADVKKRCPEATEDWLPKQLSFKEFCRFWEMQTPESKVYMTDLIAPGAEERLKKEEKTP